MMNLTEKEQIQIFKTAFESSYDGIHILDASGRTLYINEACTRIEGTTAQEVLKKNIRDLVKDGIYSQSVTLMVLEKKEAMTIIQTAKNGRQILVTGTPTFDDKGEIDKIVVNSRDITDLNNLKKELLYKEELAEKYLSELELLRKEMINHKDIISKSVAMQRIMSLAATVAKVESTVLITGETGVGKGIVAELIHKLSERRKGPFIKIDCTSIPETLFESELFGYEKGAFTGAERLGKTGLLELADGGTVFFDEVGEMPLSMQPKIMRAIQDKEILSVGGKNVKSLDIRIIAATNMDIQKMVLEKTFRDDLYYRLNVVPIVIPPLRERREDIFPLIQKVVDTINQTYGWEKVFSDNALRALVNYSWPGNVRELENLIEWLMVSNSETTIDLEGIPAYILEYGNIVDCYEIFREGDYKERLSKFDKWLLEKAIKEAGSIPKAAKLLEIDVTTLRRKLNKYENIE